MNPFANDSSAGAIGGMTVENGRGRVTLYGSLDLTRDQAGLSHAKALRALLDTVVSTLKADPALPVAVSAKPVRRVKNPFGPG